MSLNTLQNPRLARIIAPLFLSGLLLVLGGCIVTVQQPEYAAPGETIRVELKKLQDGAGVAHLAVRLPLGWQVIGEPVYYGGPTGTLTYSPTLATTLGQFGTVPGTYWWAGSAITATWSQDITVTHIITIQTALTATGVYTLNYAEGFSGSSLSWYGIVSKPITITSEFSPTGYFPLVFKN